MITRRDFLKVTGAGSRCRCPDCMRRFFFPHLAAALLLPQLLLLWLS